MLLSILVLGYTIPIKTVIGPLNQDKCLGDYQVPYSVLFGDLGKFQHDKKVALSGACNFEMDTSAAIQGSDDRVRLKLYLF